MSRNRAPAVRNTASVQRAPPRHTTLRDLSDLHPRSPASIPAWLRQPLAGTAIPATLLAGGYRNGRRSSESGRSEIADASGGNGAYALPIRRSGIVGSTAA